MSSPDPVSAPIQVPYHSQFGTGASLISADCGETCALMLAQGYGKALDERVDDFVRALEDWNGYTSADDLIKLLGLFGLKASNHKDVTAPGICLIRYSHFSSRADKKYTGLHWVVYLRTEGSDVVVHDPDFWGEGGKEKHYPLAEWQAGYLGVCVGVDAPGGAA